MMNQTTMQADIFGSNSDFWLMIAVMLVIVLAILFTKNKEGNPLLLGNPKEPTTITRQKAAMCPDNQILSSETITITSTSPKEAKLLYDQVKNDKEGYYEKKK